MGGIVKVHPGTRLEIIGDGTERRRLSGIAKEVGVEKSVSLEGWREFSAVPGLIGGSSICVIPHLKSEHTDTTIPNKIFDYMAMGKPIVVSDCEPLQRLVREEQCGVVFRSGDGWDLSRKIIQLLEDKDRDAYGRNGKRAVELKYNWDIDAKTMIVAIEKLRYGKG